MEAKEQHLDGLFTTLSTQIASGAHRKALKVLDEILKIVPQDKDALNCRVVAFIQLEEFEQALKAISAAKLDEELLLEKALQSLSACSEDDPSRFQLEAQVHYRLGRSKECIQLYDRLFQKHKVDSLDLKTNVLAAYVSAKLSTDIPEIMTAMKISSKQSFEVGFNRACGLLENGQFDKAETELRLAIRLGQETLLDEEYAEEEVEEELAPLRAQLAYALLKQQRSAEAVTEGLKVLEGEAADEATMAVATINQLCSTIATGGGAKKFWSGAAKKLDAFFDKASGQPVAALAARMSQDQLLALRLDHAMLCFAVGRLEQCQTALTALSAQQPTSQYTVLLQAALQARQGQVEQADQLLASFSTAQPSQSLYPTLMRAQLAAERGQAAQAAQLLGGLPQLRSAPGALASCASLCEQAGDLAGAESLLELALQELQSRGSGAAGPCLQRLVELRLALGKPEGAVAAYKQLAGRGAPGSVQVLSKLVRAAAASGRPELLASLEREVPGMPRGNAPSVDALEDAVMKVVGGGMRKETGHKRSADPAAQQAAKKRKKRKPRLPKAFDPANPGPPPDPERWMPKWQRAGFKQKKNRRQRRQPESVKGSQGAGKVDESLDRTKPMDVDQQDAAGSSKAARPKGKGRK